MGPPLNLRYLQTGTHKPRCNTCTCEG